MIQETEQTSSVTLFDLFANYLIAGHLVAHLDLHGILTLGATNKSFQALINQSPVSFRHLDLTTIRKAQYDPENSNFKGIAWRRGEAVHHDCASGAGVWWRNVLLDQDLTEEEFYTALMRGMFDHLRQRNILVNVHTLILDGMPGVSDLCYDIINADSFNVQILSLLDIPSLNEAKLRGALQYACRDSRPNGKSKLKGLYIFGSRNREKSTPALGASPEAADTLLTRNSDTKMVEDAWWSDSRKGEVIRRSISSDWANCLMACEGAIAFDAVLCKGPRHLNSPVHGQCEPSPLWRDNFPAVATHAVKGCAGCGKAPEGVIAKHSHVATQLPMLSPPPALASTLSAATTPQRAEDTFVPRCKDCLTGRCCRSCNVWLCEDCYQVPTAFGSPASPSLGSNLAELFTASEANGQTVSIKPPISKSCWECGDNCRSCIEKTQRICQKCRSGYCIVHNEGSNATHCDWCVTRGRRLGKDASASKLRQFQNQRRRPLVRDDGRLIRIVG